MDIEERFELLEETVQRLVQGMTNVGLFHNNQIERPPQNPNPKNQEDRTIKIDIPDFDGYSHDPEHYLDWEARMDQYFEYKETPPDCQLKLAKVKMTKIAATWLEGLQRQRRREDRGRIETWDKLKKHLRR